ncbi:MAG TPA: O-antigen ligase family protein [Candidatus Dormibacteraeota bacterium]|nr:O-antigen ligase family protein [Candidatus Dormibacteraeota bacterium]
MIFRNTAAARRGHTSAWLVPACLVVAGLLVLGAAMVGLSLVLAAGVGIALIALAAWRWPVWTAVFYAAFMSVDRFVVLLVFHVTGSDLLTKMAQLWKDEVVALLLARVVYQLLFTKAPRRIQYVDLLVMAFIVLTAVYLVYPGPFNVDPFTRLQGFRTDATFLFAYLIGRGLAIDRRQLRWLTLALIPGSLVGMAVALWQVLAPTSAGHFFDLLGFQQFSGLQGTLTSEAIRGRGVNGVDLPRASALQLGDLALAFYQLYLVVIAAALFFEARVRRDQLLSGAFLIAMGGTLILTGSRSAIVAGAVAVTAMAILGRAPLRLIVVGGAGLACGLIALVASGVDLTLVPRLLTLSDPSSVAHASAAVRSLDLIQSQPFGGGLGTAGTIGQRYLGDLSITNENWFLQIGSEMGVIGAVLFAAICVAVTALATHRYLGVKDYWLRVLTLSTVGAGLGFLVLGNFLHAWENTVLSIFIWLMAGLALRARSLEASEEYQR